MTRKRDIRAQRAASRELDHSWIEDRDLDQQQEGNCPIDEHVTPDEFADLARDFRG